MLLFISPECEDCTAVINYLELKQITYHTIDATTEEGMKLIKRYGVGSVPALIVLEGDTMIDSARGLDEIEGLISHG